MTSEQGAREKLAINGGPPARSRPEPPMYPGGMYIAKEEEEAVLEVLRTKRLFRYYGPEEGPSKVAEFEQAFAEHMGAEHALAVNSGTSSLVCALRAIGVGPGDEVIVPAYTWIASAAAVIASGGVPIMAEVDDSLTLDPQDVELKISPYTKAIMPVHMRGAPSDMDPIMDVARQHNLVVIEDTAQADGGSYKGQRLGTIGDVGCFSLQFNKIITSGEGGVVITDDPQILRRATMFHDVIGGLRNEIPRDEVLWGINFRMTELQAAVMLVQLRRLDGVLVDMRARKEMLKAGTEDVVARKGMSFRRMTDPAGDAAVALIMFATSVEKAEEITEALRAENIGASVMYNPDRMDYHVYQHWLPIMEQRTWTESDGPWAWAQRKIEYAPDMCPRTLDLLGRAVHLDVNPLLTNQDVEETVDGINKVLEALA